jgi:hypothetical protein
MRIFSKEWWNLENGKVVPVLNEAQCRGVQEQNMAER